MDLDHPTKSIVEFVRSVDSNSLTAGCTHAVVRNFLDGIGCAAAGFPGESPTLLRGIALGTTGPFTATAYGLTQPVLAEFAILANSAATRYQDWNDAGVHAGHPSDMGPAIMAMVEANQKSGRDFVAALYVSYQTVKAVGKVVRLNVEGWDQGFYTSIGVTAALSYLLHLSDEQIANALSVALTPSIPLGITRTGAISQWKSIASGHASVTATLAVRLAQAGMTGPPRVFDGIAGVFEKVTGPFEIGEIAPKEGELTVPEQVAHKAFPVLNIASGPVQMTLHLREQFDVSEIKSISLRTFHFCWFAGAGGQGDEQEKRHPQSRESADHSVYFAMARALLDGYLSAESYTPGRISDPALGPLIEKITVILEDDYTKEYEDNPDALEHSRLEIVLKDGRTLVEEITLPSGHRKNPMTDEALNTKFDSSVTHVLSESRHRELRERLWNLPKEENVDAIASILRNFHYAGASNTD